MKLSQRYVPHLCALLAAALIPVAVHSYAGLRADECADPFRLVPETHRGAAEQKRDSFMRKRFSAHQWKDGRLSPRGRLAPLKWTVIRSYDAKNLYYLMTRRLLDVSPDREELVWIEAGGLSLPVRRSTIDPPPGSRASIAASHLLVYDGRPVENPYLNQLRAAPSRILRGALPMTVFFASSITPEDQLEATFERQARFLVESFERYRSICFP